MGHKMTTEQTPTSQDIATMIEIIVRAAEENAPPEKLNELAAKASYPPATFQKIFSRYVGMSPTRFRRYMDFQNASDFLLKGYPTLEAAHQAGLSGNGRLHEACVQIEAATPGQYAQRGKGLHIKHGTIGTPIGQLCIGLSPHGLCWAGFAVNGDEKTSLHKMKNFWKNATFSKASINELHQLSKQVENLWHAYLSPHPHETATAPSPLRLYLEGSNFQIKVWQALLQIPTGGTTHYGALAHAIGAPKASRAIGAAVGANPISWIIPCHRVIKQCGVIHNYAWGTARKKSLLSIESALSSTNHND